MGALNLAQRPFRNERLPTLLLLLGCLVLGVLTLRHAIVARNLLPGRAMDVEREAVELEAELSRLRAEAQRLGGDAQPPAALKEWAAVKELVDRRAFSWSRLFADLEKVLPAGVHLVGIAPQAGKGGLVLALNARGREVEDALALLEALQKDPHFHGASLEGYAEAEAGLDIQCRVMYSPETAAIPKAGAPSAGGSVGATP
jgi:type IV pilus assembly protein PilN